MSNDCNGKNLFDSKHQQFMLGADDKCMVAALVSSFAYSILFSIALDSNLVI
mgnify:CR=1 FL=1